MDGIDNKKLRVERDHRGTGQTKKTSWRCFKIYSPKKDNSLKIGALFVPIYICKGM